MARYFGRICLKHPELNGERVSSDRHCVGCKKARSKDIIKKWKRTDKGKESARSTAQKQRDADPHIHRVKNSNRRALILNRTPVWANMDAIREVYREASEKGMSVDHYFPLKGKKVSGLHVHHNLRLMPLVENILKNNKEPE